jgi:hypothetical protein
MKKFLLSTTCASWLSTKRGMRWSRRRWTHIPHVPPVMSEPITITER